MVTKVVTDQDVDNVTIIINPQNKLEAKIPTTSNEVVIEEVPNVSQSNSVVTLNGTERRITKLGKVNGTEWLVFQLDAPLVTNEPVTPVQSEPEQPPNSSINTHLNYSCGSVEADGNRYVLSSPISVQVTTSDTGGKTPQTVKFDVKIGSQTHTYSYPYSASNTYEWANIGDFNYEGITTYSVKNARVEFTDGSVSLPSLNTNPACMMSSLPD